MNFFGAIFFTLIFFSTPTSAQEEIASLNSSALGMVTGHSTATYYRFGNDMKDVVEKSGVELLVKESGGSIDNIKRLSSKENAALGIVQSDVLGFLLRSKADESKKLAKRLRLIAPFYHEEIHVLASKNITSFANLEDKTVVVGPKGSGSWLTAMNLFSMTEIRPRKTLRLKPDEGLVAVLRGKADAMIFVSGKPVKLFKNLSTLSKHANYAKMLNKVHFIPLTESSMLEEYTPSSITSKDYSFVKKSVPTIAVSSLLVSFDFSNKSSAYAKARCNKIRQFSNAIAENIDLLKNIGHQKWQEVDLNADIGIWKRDNCSVIGATSPASLENELLNVLRSR